MQQAQQRGLSSSSENIRTMQQAQQRGLSSSSENIRTMQQAQQRGLSSSSENIRTMQQAQQRGLSSSSENIRTMQQAQQRGLSSSSKNIRTTHTSTTERDFSSSSKNIRMTHTSITERDSHWPQEHSAMTSLSLQLYLAIFISSGSNAMALRSEASPFLLSFLFSRFSSRRICFCSCRSSSDWQSDKNNYQQNSKPQEWNCCHGNGVDDNSNNGDFCSSYF